MHFARAGYYSTHHIAPIGFTGQKLTNQPYAASLIDYLESQYTRQGLTVQAQTKRNGTVETYILRGGPLGERDFPIQNHNHPVADSVITGLAKRLNTPPQTLIDAVNNLGKSRTRW
jgi:hypothetical protein